MVDRKKFRPLTMDDPMPFGQYTGKELWEIVEEDPRYLDWLMGESETFVVDDETFQAINKALKI